MTENQSFQLLQVSFNRQKLGRALKLSSISRSSQEHPTCFFLAFSNPRRSFSPESWPLISSSSFPPASSLMFIPRIHRTTRLQGLLIQPPRPQQETLHHPGEIVVYSGGFAIMLLPVCLVHTHSFRARAFLPHMRQASRAYALLVCTLSPGLKNMPK